jgi:urate oxidase
MVQIFHQICYNKEPRETHELALRTTTKSTQIQSSVIQQGYLSEVPSLTTNVYFLPLHVSALVGHLQAEYTTISGSYFTFF